MDQNYDLIIIGAGPGGHAAALRAAALGKRVAVVERREIGGTCLNRGCVPTKTLLHAADVYRSVQNSEDLGVSAVGARANWAKIYDCKNAVVQNLRGGMETALKRAKVAVLHGTGTVLAPGLVRVTGEDGAADYACTHVLLATGAEPARPPIPGLDLPGVLTSDDLLAVPPKAASLVIIGGGVIGVEFATFFNDLGREVTILEGLDRLLPGLDRELGQGLAQAFKTRGAQIQTGARVEAVEQTGDELTVRYTQKDRPGAVCAKAVLCAIGRRPYMEGLFGPDLAPRLDGRRLAVDDAYQTSIPGVYAIGDLSSPVQLAHAATAQGVACVERLCGVPVRTDPALIPGCVYCRPEIASVGLTEAAAKEAGIPVVTGKGLNGANARSLIAGSGRGFVKLVVHAETGVLLGAQLFLDRATDLVAELTTAIENRLTAADLLRPVRPHPTYSEVIGDALQAVIGKLEKRG